MTPDIPTLSQAQALLAWAEGQNPGPWADHSRTAARAAGTIAAACGLDADKASVLGLLHDVGRYEGKRALHHAVAGYRLLTERGFAAAARICLTHSFPLPVLECFSGSRDDCTPEETALIRSALAVEMDEYDRLAQLCDALALAQGVCLLDVRLVDVARRHGFNAYTLPKWEAFFGLKRHFDDLCGQSIYDLFYDEIRRVSFR